MKIIFNYLFILTLTFVSIKANSQDLNIYLDSIYGLNPVLYNGQFNPNSLPSNIKGHPFLYGKDYVKGNITIDNKVYENVKLNYDIYKQDLLMQYNNQYGSKSIIKLSNIWVQRFTIDNKRFELIETPDIKRTIYQVLGTDSIKVLYQWSKRIDLNQISEYAKYNFSKPKKKMFILNNNNLYKFKNRKSFINSYNPDLKKSIKKYLKVNKIKIKKVSDIQMLNLINYCNNLKN